MDEIISYTICAVKVRNAKLRITDYLNTSIDPVLELIYILMLNINPIFADNLGEKNAVIKLND